MNYSLLSNYIIWQNAAILCLMAWKCLCGETYNVYVDLNHLEL